MFRQLCFTVIDASQRPAFAVSPECDPALVSEWIESSKLALT